MSGVFLPGSTIGVIGGGQLGRMLALEGRRMGYRFMVLDPTPRSSAAQIADEQITAPLDDLDAARELARRSDIITLEWENADADALRELEGVVPFRPGPGVLEVAQHRLLEKDTARRLGLPTAEYRPVRNAADLEAAIEDLGLPLVLKTTRGGYDGRGQKMVHQRSDAEAAFAELVAMEPELIAEQWIDFRCEVSVICARGPGGEMVTYTVGENVHHEGMLASTKVPADIPEQTARDATQIGEAFAEGIGVVGLLAVEMFVRDDETVLVNEIAPRPHNSGHYTWEACATSQFEQHLRAVCGLPLGSPELLRPAAMINLIGDQAPRARSGTAAPEALAVPTASLHLYGKEKARPRRKMGHVTALGDTADEAIERARRAHRAFADGESAVDESGSST